MQTTTANHTINPLLRSDGRLRLMTAPAQRLVRGRHLKSGDDKVVPPIVGLLHFASLLRMIWLGARQDDPYADLWLLRIHQALQDGGQELIDMHSALDELFKRIPEGVEVRIAEAATPMEIPLRFATPYAFSAAYFLCSYDDYMRKALTARHVGILSWSAAGAAQGRAGRLVRRTFLSATGYRFTGVTRADIASGSARAGFAARQMGMVPKSVLDGTERAPHAPSPGRRDRKGQGQEEKQAAPDATAPDATAPDTVQSG